MGVSFRGDNDVFELVVHTGPARIQFRVPNSLAPEDFSYYICEGLIDHIRMIQEKGGVPEMVHGYSGDLGFTQWMETNEEE